jgi:CheY-like chemotaxis protein
VKTVLVVDDDQPFREMLRAVLESRGFRVLLADDGRAALSVVETEPLDAVLTDFEMPHTTGIELCRELAGRSQRLARALPVWLMTGCPRLRTEDAVAAGALGLYRKPFRAVKIALEIAGYLRGSGPAARVA